MGAFTQDFEYEEGYGDLDECNGRVGVTPEFPEGIYYYVVTDAFPISPDVSKAISIMLVVAVEEVYPIVMKFHLEIHAAEMVL